MNKDVICPKCGSSSCVEWLRITTNEYTLEETETLEILCLGCMTPLPDRRKNSDIEPAKSPTY